MTEWYRIVDDPGQQPAPRCAACNGPISEAQPLCQTCSSERPNIITLHTLLNRIACALEAMTRQGVGL